MPDFPPELALPLKKKLRIGDSDVAVLALREPIALELEQSDGDLGLLARIAGIDDAKAFGGIAGSDYAKALEYMQWFSRTGQLIGSGPDLIDPDAVPEEYVLSLLKPLDKGGEPIAELLLAEPTAAQLEGAGRTLNWITNNLMTLQLVTKMPIGILRQMGARDFARASEYIRFFSRSGQLSGSG